MIISFYWWFSFLIKMRFAGRILWWSLYPFNIFHNIFFWCQSYLLILISFLKPIYFLIIFFSKSQEHIFVWFCIVNIRLYHTQTLNISQNLILWICNRMSFPLIIFIILNHWYYDFIVVLFIYSINFHNDLITWRDAFVSLK